jgi:hypothetical protein
MTPPVRYQRMTGGISWARESRWTESKIRNDLLTAHRYQRAFVDFFEDQLVQKKYDWKLVLKEFLYGGKHPLINGIVSGRKFVTP